jgi:hypothetical protein
MMEAVETCEKFFVLFLSKRLRLGIMRPHQGVTQEPMGSFKEQKFRLYFFPEKPVMAGWQI